MIRPLIREFQIAYYRWALREMPLDHPDLIHVIVTLRDLKAERERSNSIYARLWRWC